MYYFIEPMLEEDIEQVQAIERQSFTTLWSVSTYRREIRHTSSSRYIVARASSSQPPPRSLQRTLPRRGIFTQFLSGFFTQPVAASPYPLAGYGGLWLTESEAHVTTIAVAPKQRGKGVGELLLNSLIDHALDLRAGWLSLEVRVSNTVAQNLYLKYGFRPSGTRVRYYTDNNEDALMMWTDPIQSAEFQQRLATLRQQLYARLRAEAEQGERDQNSSLTSSRYLGSQ